MKKHLIILFTILSIIGYSQVTPNLNQVLGRGNDGGAKQIKNIKNPTASQDAATKHYCDSIGSLIGSTPTVTITGAGTTSVTSSGVGTTTPSYTVTTPASTYSGTVTSVGAVAGANMSITGTSPITTSGTYTFINTAPNQTVTLTGAGSTSVSGTYPTYTVTGATIPTTPTVSAGSNISVSGSPNYTVTNTAPNQTVTLTNGTGISIGGSYPTYTITNSSPSSGGTVTSVGIVAGSNMSITGSSPITTSGTLTVTNTAPDQTVSLTGAGTTTTSGTYPNFTITGANTASVVAGSNISLSSSTTSNVTTYTVTNTSPSSGGTVTSVSASSPLSSSGGNTPTITITSPLPLANGGTNNTVGASTLSAINTTTANATWYPVIVSSGTGNQAINTTTATLTFNPSTSNLSATSFTGALTGNVTGNCSGSSGTATHATGAANLDGGNNTTLLGSLPYQSNANVTSMLSPNVSSTKNYLQQTGTGTNGAAPVWATIAAPDVPTLNQNTTGSSASCTGNSATATTATNATNVAVTNQTGNTVYYLVGVTAGTGNLPINSYTAAIQFNPSTSYLGINTGSITPSAAVDNRGGLIMNSGVSTSYTVTTNPITAAQVQGGLLVVTSGTVTLTMPTTANLVSTLNAKIGTWFDFAVINNSTGTCTMAVGTGMTAASGLTGGTTLTVATLKMVTFRVMFYNTTTSFISRISG